MRAKMRTTIKAQEKGKDDRLTKDDHSRHINLRVKMD